MPADRYLKIILTVIALELFWIGVKDAAPPVSAQQSPMPVVIRGVQLENDATPTGRMLPVNLLNAPTPVKIEADRPLRIETLRPLKIEADTPIRIETDRPLPVESVPYTPSRRPGE